MLKSEKTYYLYTFLIAFISVFAWKFCGFLAMPLIIVIGAVMLVLTNDIKSVFPALVNLIFVNNVVAADENINITLYISGGLFIGVLIYYFIRNKIKIRFNSYGIIMLILAVLSVIPLIYFQPENSVFLILYFNWILYLVVYLFFSNTVKGNLTDEFSLAMEGLLILISSQTIYSIANIYFNDLQSINQIYTLGWGMCNEAGIMLCVALPFAFYMLYKTWGSKKMLVHLAIILFTILGIIATFSRGTFLFGALEFVALVLYFLIKKRYFIVAASLVIFGLAASIILICLKYDTLLEDISSFIYDNGRIVFYNMTIEQIESSPIKALFGSGFAHHIDTADKVIVCHSTLYETLAVMGFVGLAVLMVLISLKYYHCLKTKDAFGIFVLLGFVFVDLYGMIDNTYHMYYYMIILVMILAVLENRCKGVE